MPVQTANRRDSSRGDLGAVAAIVITITILEFLANRVAFASAYNWFHM